MTVIFVMNVVLACYILLLFNDGISSEFIDSGDFMWRDANNPLDMKPLPKEPDDERRKKSKVAKGTVCKAFTSE